MAQIPLEHKQDSVKLNPPQLIELFELTLKSGAVLRFHNGREITWNEQVFEEAVVNISGVARNSGETRIRPALTLGNPLAIFHVPVSQGLIEGAQVVRYKVKPANLDANPPIFEINRWYISQVTGLGEAITCELRSNSDRQESTLPARQYLKPEFPAVT